MARIEALRRCLQYAGEISKRGLIFTVRSTVHSNRERKRSFSKNALQTGGIRKRWF